jgi:uncharacterized protein (TIGR00730 family)
METEKVVKRVSVYCASSSQVDPRYHQAAHRVGEVLAAAGVAIVYGGGGAGSMGAVADGALASDGEVIGVLPRFMADLEWGHPGLTKLDLVEDMRERKHKMLVDSDAVIALPGGCGTFEELFEALTLKRLGLYTKPIILLNTLDYYQPCVAMLQQAIDQNFMNLQHGRMWTVVDEPEGILAAIQTAPEWSEQAREFAVSHARD